MENINTLQVQGAYQAECLHTHSERMHPALTVCLIEEIL